MDILANGAGFQGGYIHTFINIYYYYYYYTVNDSESIKTFVMSKYNYHAYCNTSIQITQGCMTYIEYPQRTISCGCLCNAYCVLR